MSDPVVQAIKREVRRFSDGLKVEETEIVALLNEGILRRDLVEGDEAMAAQIKVSKMNKQPPLLRRWSLRKRTPRQSQDPYQ
jgi:hypothetical protein